MRQSTFDGSLCLANSYYVYKSPVFYRLPLLKTS
jgi:hypothetical protein